MTIMTNELFDEIYDPEKLLKKIGAYRNVDLKKYSLDKIIQDFNSFFTQFNLICSNLDNIPLFRVRKIEDNKEHLLKKDVWCPTPDKVEKLGRANKIGESVFYAAFDPITAIKETWIQPNEKFSLSIYNINSYKSGLLSTINISIPKPIDNLQISKNQRIHMMILSDFLFAEFTRLVGIGTEYQYKASCAVSKILLQIPNKDSLIYPSLVDYSKRNIVINEDSAKERLTLKQVFECKLNSFSDNFNPIIDIYKESIPDNDSDKLDYKPFNKDAVNVELKYENFFKGTNTSELIINKMKDFLK